MTEPRKTKGIVVYVPSDGWYARIAGFDRQPSRYAFVVALAIDAVLAVLGRLFRPGAVRYPNGKEDSK